ncbi:MAG: winged helix-turn-helix domain-containing protein [Proteobacteria bacterium]|nr:winged helix-turn-helix domain-containing protein [Pseudomonadota bacterium]
MIEENVLRPGDRLPSSRSLSEALGINRTTVTKAYEDLWAMGYTESRSGSYSMVRNRAEIVDEKKADAGKLIECIKSQTPGAGNLLQR